MYFNDKFDTNIDDQFSNNNNKNIQPLEIIKKYKKIIAIVSATIIILIFLFIFLKKENYEITLYGDSRITLYQGDEYVELGYSAYDSKDKNLTNNVKIESNLNINQIGEYEIKYSLENITKIRKIKVIEKPKEYTYIYLNSINNSVNVYLQLGEKYIEPGYQVFNSKGLNLNSNVKITGTVDTSKKGNYKLVYSVEDSNNVVISTTRTVIVMDSEIHLSLTPDTYTKNNVTINVGVLDNYFEYMILPNGNRVDKTTYSYPVDKNGKYTFTIYNNKGGSKTSTIEVKNIDRTIPNGSCSGYYQNGKSIINVKASDSSGISKYVINGISYNQNNITINKEQSSVTITIHDKAGNTKNISCRLQNKNTQTPPSSSTTPNNPPSGSVTPNKPPTNNTPQYQNPLDKIYTSTNSYTNSKNGIRYLLYNQSDSKWGSVQYPDGATIKNNGCMITTVAVVSSSYDNTITPKTVFDKYRHNYPYVAINKLAGEAFQCKHVWSNMKSTTIDALNEGKPVIIMVYGYKKGGSSSFTTSQHYMALLDYKDGKIFVGNSYSNNTYGKTGWFDKDEVLTSVQEVNICTPTNQLLNKFK